MANGIREMTPEEQAYEQQLMDAMTTREQLSSQDDQAPMMSQAPAPAPAPDLDYEQQLASGMASPSAPDDEYEQQLSSGMGAAGEPEPAPAGGGQAESLQEYRLRLATAMDARAPSRMVATPIKPVLEQQLAEAEVAGAAEVDAARRLAEIESKSLADISEIERQQRDYIEDHRIDKIAQDFARQEYAREEQEKVDRLAQQYGSGRIKPYYEGKTTGQRIGQAIAIAFGALGEAASGGENTALRIIESQIDEDLQIQKANLAQKGEALSARRGALAQTRQMWADDDMAMLAAKDAYLASAQAEMRSRAAISGSREVTTRADEKIAQIEQRRSELRGQIQIQIESMGYQRVGGGLLLSPEQRKVLSGEIAASREIETAGAKASIEQPTKQAEKAAEDRKDALGSISNAMMTAEVPATWALLDEFEAEADRLAGKYPNRFQRNPSSVFSKFVTDDEQRGLQQLAQLLIRQVAIAYNRGALSEGDVLAARQFVEGDFSYAAAKRAVKFIRKALMRKAQTIAARDPGAAVEFFQNLSDVKGIKELQDPVETERTSDTSIEAAD